MEGPSLVLSEDYAGDRIFHVSQPTAISEASVL